MICEHSENQRTLTQVRLHNLQMCFIFSVFRWGCEAMKHISIHTCHMVKRYRQCLQMFWRLCCPSLLGWSEKGARIAFGQTIDSSKDEELLPEPHKMEDACISKISATLFTSTKCKDPRGESIKIFSSHNSQMNKSAKACMQNYN
jgi:hypothetical protein